MILSFFFFNDTATTEIYTLSLHDALPISEDLQGTDGQLVVPRGSVRDGGSYEQRLGRIAVWNTDRKSTRLNSSHGYISYAVFCLKKKKHTQTRATDLLLE